jgi:hypothetical protein
LNYVWIAGVGLKGKLLVRHGYRDKPASIRCGLRFRQ